MGRPGLPFHPGETDGPRARMRIRLAGFVRMALLEENLMHASKRLALAVLAVALTAGLAHLAIQL